jgi:hypothetical protein
MSLMGMKVMISSIVEAWLVLSCALPGNAKGTVQLEDLRRRYLTLR